MTARPSSAPDDQPTASRSTAKADGRRSGAPGSARLRRLAVRLGSVVLLAVALFYVVNLAGLILATQRAARAEAELERDVAALATEVAELEAAADHAESDAYVERWAREERKWTKSGDRVLVPVPTTPTAEVEPAPGTNGDGGRIERLLRWLRGG